MILDYGDIKNPTGNAVIYWRIQGNNAHFSHAEIVASNFVISPLQFSNETLMVNFPPVLVENYEKLLQIAENHNVDLIQGGNIYIPDDATDINEVYKKQVNQYNGIIQEYLLAFKEMINSKSERMSVPKLINRAGMLMEKIRAYVSLRNKKDEVTRSIDELQKIQHQLDSEMKGFDLSPIITLIDRPEPIIDHLVELYRRKFIAIFLEDYEKAEILKREIRAIEGMFFTTKLKG